MSAFDLNSVTESASTSATTYPYPNQGFVDVHAHLLHEKFAGKEHEVVQGCLAAGLDHVIINGLEPVSNRQILDFCEQYYPIHMLPAMGIYPLDAACNFIYSQEDVDRIKQERSDSDHNQNNETSAQPLPEVNWKHDFPPPTRFDVDAEIDFIEEMVKTKRIVALGECGLDKHYLTDEVSFAEQVRVLRKLMKIAAKYDIPIILHTRKAEKKVFDMLIEENVKKADFHCYCGKVNFFFFDIV
jgi:TatD DNase family protein